MGITGFLRRNYITNEWVFYCVIASFVPILCRLIAACLSSVEMYDNFDVLYTGLGLNVASLNLMAGKNIDNKTTLVNSSIFLIFLIAFVLGINYKGQNDTPTEAIKITKIVFFNLFTFFSLLLSFKANKSVLTRVSLTTT